MRAEKQQVHDFWNQAACGEALYLSDADRVGFATQAEARYALEPYILEFAGFSTAKGKQVLEIGVGLGADHQKFAEAGAALSGIDLTKRAVEYTKRRLAAFGLSSNLAVGDAENLGFPSDSFDVVYSWGVLHHSPDTPKAFSEVWRVLKPGGTARIMIYYKWSMVGLMLWVRYALLRFRPWMTLDEVYSRFLESPGTKAYTIDGARKLCAQFTETRIRTVLTHGDLLESGAGQRHQGVLLTIARRIWPKSLIRRWLPNNGLFMLIEARK